MVSDRGLEILKAAVEEFVRRGEPVSSRLLYERYDFGIKPAMIRLELERLEDEGFLEQWYRSAGRVPSDRGLEFFAEEAVQNSLGAEAPREARQVLRLMARGLWGEALRGFSDGFGVASAVADRENGVLKEGLEALLESFPEATPDGLRGVVRDFVHLDERIPEARRGLKRESAPQVFVGRKSPVTKSEELSVVIGRCGADAVFFAIGPRRMDYRRVARAMCGIMDTDIDI